MTIIEPEALLKKIKTKFDKNDLLVFLTVFIFGFINNFYFIMTEGIAPDALSPAHFNIAGNWEITLGRFGIKYINILRYGFVNKLIIVLISLILLAISVILIKRLFKIKSKILLILVASLIAIAPQFTETYMFIYCADAYMVAFFLAILSVYFLDKARNKKKYYLFSILCTVAVCSLYQAYLGVLIGTCIMLIAHYILDGSSFKDAIKTFFIFMTCVFIGVILYYIILQVILSALGLSLASYKGANSLGFETIKSIPTSIIQCFKDFYAFFFTNKIINNSYYDRKYLYFFLLLIITVGSVLILLKNRKLNLFKVLLLCFLILIFPIGINIMNVIAPTTTINLVTGPGLIISILAVVLVYQNLSQNRFSTILKYGILISIIILNWSFLIENTFTYIAREQTYKNYYTIASDIYTKVTNLENYSPEQEWLFSDVIRFQVRDAYRANGFISDDNMTWNNYSGLSQNSSFYEKYLGIKIKIVSIDKYREIVKSAEFKSMPVYPNYGSIKIIDDVVVIKVSNSTF